MEHRLTKIYTRTGDDGSTGLADGTRTAKDSVRIVAIGEVDELNSVQGQPAELGGYYRPDRVLASKVMRPSGTLNAIIDSL